MFYMASVITERFFQMSFSKILANIGGYYSVRIYLYIQEHWSQRGHFSSGHVTSSHLPSLILHASTLPMDIVTSLDLPDILRYL